MEINQKLLATERLLMSANFIDASFFVFRKKVLEMLVLEIYFKGSYSKHTKGSI